MSTDDRDYPVPWRSRGIGLDQTYGCFVCGAERRNSESNSYMHNIAALLSKRDEFPAVECFDRGCRMAYYHGDPNVPQIKVGACDKHLPVLEELGGQWFISQKRVRQMVRDAIMVDEYHERQYTAKDADA